MEVEESIDFAIQFEDSAGYNHERRLLRKTGQRKENQEWISAGCQHLEASQVMETW